MEQEREVRLKALKKKLGKIVAQNLGNGNGKTRAKVSEIPKNSLEVTKAQRSDIQIENNDQSNNPKKEKSKKNPEYPKKEKGLKINGRNASNAAQKQRKQP